MSYLVPFRDEQTTPRESDGDGRSLFPRNRRLVCDLLHFAKQTPSCAHDRELNLAKISELRGYLSTRISWPALFIRAYAMVAERFSDLRKSYMAWPFPHVYQHPTSVAMLSVQRQVNGIDWLCFGRFLSPEEMSLSAIQLRLDAYRNEPAEKIFRRQFRFSAFPVFLRRLAWWVTLNLQGDRRARRVGTFGLSSISNLGAVIQHPPSFLTSTITYGPLDSLGRCRFTVVYDHRLMDGVYIAKALCEVQVVFDNDISAELENLINGQSLASARRAA